MGRRAASSSARFATGGPPSTRPGLPLGLSAKRTGDKQVHFNPSTLVVPVPGFCPARLPQSKGLRALWRDEGEEDETQEEEETPMGIYNAIVDESASPELDEECTRLFAAAAARANFLSLDRPDVSFSAKELCRRMSAPRVADLLALRRLARYLLGPRVLWCIIGGRRYAT